MWCSSSASLCIVFVSSLVFLACQDASCAPTQQRAADEVVQEFVQGDPENHDWYPALELENELGNGHNKDATKVEFKTICEDGNGKDCKNKNDRKNLKADGTGQVNTVLGNMNKMTGTQNGGGVVNIIELEDKHIQERKLLRGSKKEDSFQAISSSQVISKPGGESLSISHSKSVVDDPAEVNINAGINANMNDLIKEYPKGKWPPPVELGDDANESITGGKVSPSKTGNENLVKASASKTATNDGSNEKSNDYLYYEDDDVKEIDVKKEIESAHGS